MYDILYYLYMYVFIAAGQKFAMFELKVVMSFILRNYKIKSHLSLEEVRPVGDLILRPQYGLRTTITRRG
jgi:cytochrome P450 family 4 subfamily V